MIVYKYELPTDDRVELALPQGAELLTVGVQDDKLMLWARIDPSEPTVHRRFRVAGTGHPAATGTYVGTAMLYNGRLVLHVFDLGIV